MKRRSLLGAAALALFPRIGLAANRQLVVGGMATPDTAGEEIWRRFLDRIAESGGFDVRALLAGELGPEETMFATLRRGRVDFANVSAHGLGTVVPEFGLLSAPYLFESEEEADFVVDTYLFEPFSRLLVARGVKLLMWSEVGWDHVYGRTPLLTPEDAKDYRFRVLRSLGSQEFARAIGADAIGISYTEVVPSLQTGLIDGGQSSIAMYARSGIADYAPHLTLTYHGYGVAGIVTSLRYWQRLDDSEQAALMAAYPDAAETRRMLRAESAATIDGTRDAGKFTVHRLSPQQRADWVAATAGTHRRMIAKIGGEAEALYALIQDGKRVYAERNQD